MHFLIEMLKKMNVSRSSQYTVPPWVCSEGTLLGKLSQVLPGSLFQYVPNLCSTTQMLFQKIEITNVRLQTHFINCPLPHLLLICTETRYWISFGALLSCLGQLNPPWPEKLDNIVKLCFCYFFFFNFQFSEELIKRFFSLKT